MKNDREFTGTLLGFDDFVSKFAAPHPVFAGPDWLASRHGPRGRHRVVRDLSLYFVNIPNHFLARQRRKARRRQAWLKLC